MSEHRAETPEQVLKFVPKEWPNRHGAQVEEVRRGQASLEDVFLTLMDEEHHQ